MGKQRNIKVPDEIWIPFQKRILDLKGEGMEISISEKICQLMQKEIDSIQTKRS